MLISASRRTDIPAFYAEWFMCRVREGYVSVRNPFNPRQYRRVDLSPENIKAIVFWTKDPLPLMEHLDELEERGYRFYFHYTLNGYPPLLEPSVPGLERGIETFKALSKRLGRARVIWRFDPILITSLTTEDCILRTFRETACALRGHTERVVISFACFYKKTLNRLMRLEEENGVGFTDISGQTGRIKRIAARLSESARENSMEIFSCAERHDLSSCGIRPGRCMDEGLIRELFGLSTNHKKDTSQRRECNCVESRDIGQYNTCGHGCLYCYATDDEESAYRKMRLHDCRSTSLSVALNHDCNGEGDVRQMDIFK